jgi:hypothetical protein
VAAAKQAQEKVDKTEGNDEEMPEVAEGSGKGKKKSGAGARRRHFWKASRRNCCQTSEVTVVAHPRKMPPRSLLRSAVLCSSTFRSWWLDRGLQLLWLASLLTLLGQSQEVVLGRGPGHLSGRKGPPASHRENQTAFDLEGQALLELAEGLELFGMTGGWCRASIA